MGYDPLLVSEEQFTTSSVASELRFNTLPHTRLQLALKTRKIKLHTPSKCSLKEVEKASRRAGDIFVLSKVDRDVLATALDLLKSHLSPRLVSDDYAIQNVAEFLGLRYVSLTTFGIRYRFSWILICPACKRKYPLDAEKVICSICGTPLKRKVLRKDAARGNSGMGSFTTSK